MMKSFSSSSKSSRAIATTLLALGLTAAASQAKVVTYQYIRFHPLKLRSSVDLVQASEFYFYNGGVQIPANTISTTEELPNPVAPNTEDASHATDGTTTTKWLNKVYTSAYLVFDLGSPKPFDSYNWATGNDFIDRDPVGWSIEGSNDNASWDVIDTVSGYPTTTTRTKVVSDTGFVIPNVPAPYIFSFEVGDSTKPAIVANSTSVELYIDAIVATSGRITRDSDATAIALPSVQGISASVTPPANRDTVYTFTASNVTSGGTATSTKTYTLRSVQQQSKTFRYVRFTPRKTRSGGTTVSLQELAFKNGATRVPVLAPGTGSGTTTSAANLFDTETTRTLWSPTTLTAVVADFGSSQTFDSYNFTTTSNSADQDPVQWTMEGSNDLTTWTLFENVTSMTYPTSTNRGNFSGDIPTAASVPPASFLSVNTTSVVAGEAVTLTYSSTGAASATIAPNVTTSGLSGTVSVTPQAPSTTYTLTTTDSAGRTSTASVTVNVVVPAGAINYTNFDTSSDISFVGTSKTINDFATFSNSPNAKRLRLTDLGANTTGSAWSYSKLKVKDGFEATFDAHLAFPVYVNGADGIAFTIQNAAAKYAAAPDSGLAFKNNGVSVVLDSYNDSTAITETQANLEIFASSGGAATIKANVNLDSAGQAVAKGYKGRYLVTNPTVAPYHVRVVYVPGALSVYIDGKLVADRVAVDLNAAGAVDADGKAWLGFSAKTRAIVAYHDIENWTVTPASATTPLAITSSAFTFGATPQVNLTFSSNSGTVYRVTQSADLATWTPLGADITASSTSTTVTRPFTATGSKSFFRVEQAN